VDSPFARPIRVLVLDAEESDVHLLEGALRKADLPAEVRWVCDPHEVLFAAEDEALDIAVLNLELPGVDDVLVEELRMLEGSQRVPIIAFSDSEPAEADHVFPKPREEFEFFGIVHAIRIYWMARAPTMAPPAPPSPPTARPRRLSRIDVMALPIKPAEAYLLSMLDGEMGVDELSSSIGTGIKETRGMLRRLVDLGAVSWRAPHPSLAPPGPASVPTESLAPIGSLSPPRVVDPPVAPASAARAIPPAAPQPSDPAAEPLPSLESLPPVSVPPSMARGALTETAAPAAAESPSRKSLSAERKKIVDDAFDLLGEVDHYELLGVPRDADKKAIRAAYFALAKLFHTDTLFGVELGEYGGKMDKVFKALTEAYEVLGKSKRRRAYDAYLDAVTETKGLDETPTPSLAPPPSDPQPAAEVEHEAPVADLGDTAFSSDAPPTAEPRPSRPRKDTATRKAMARELMDRLGPHPRGRRAQAARPAPPEAKHEAAAEALARTLQAVSRSRPQVDRASLLMADAAVAEKKGNLAGAAEVLRIAAAWRPDDQELARKADEMGRRALAQKAPAYEKRARYAERRENWEEAALCWMKVCEVRPDDGAAALGAARALARSGGDLREAALYAKRATELDRENADAHRELAEIYVAAGMPASAGPSLRTVLRLVPDDPRASELLAEITR